MEEHIHQSQRPLLTALSSPASTTGKPCVPYRYKLLVLTSFGIACSVSLRSNFNIALVAMVNYTEIDNYTSNECPETDSSANSTQEQKQGEFPWSSNQQSLLLGGFFYGYVLTQLVGGYLAEITGPKTVMLISVLGSGITSLLTPIMAKWNFYALFVSRILMGMSQGPLYPTNVVLWSRWAPDQEKTIFYSFSSSGSCVGYLLSPVITGVLCDLTLLGGWPLTFYLFGGVAVLWSILWLCIAHSGPEDHPGITEYEKHYITQGRSYDSKNLKLNRPWLSFFTSGAVWAIFLYSIFDGLASNGMYTGVPVYMKQILRFNVSQDGIFYALPYLGQLIVFVVSGIIADWLRKKFISTSATRKLFCILGDGCQAIFVLGIAFVPCNRVVAVALYTAATTFLGFTGSGPFANLLDIAPKYSGTLKGIANLLENIGGFVSPLITGAITKDSPNRKDWQLVFFLTAGSYTLATIVFVILGKGEEQSWAKDTPSEEDTATNDYTHFSINTAAVREREAYNENKETEK